MNTGIYSYESYNKVYTLSEFARYRQTSYIQRTLGNQIADHSDVAKASPVGTAQTTSSFST